MAEKPSEFGGYSGVYTNAQQPNVKDLPPHLQRQALYETNSADSTSTPVIGTGGTKAN